MAHLEYAPSQLLPFSQQRPFVCELLRLHAPHDPFEAYPGHKVPSLEEHLGGHGGGYGGNLK